MLPNGSLTTLPQTFTETNGATLPNGTYRIISTSSTTGCKYSCQFSVARDFSTVTPTCANVSLNCNNPSQSTPGQPAGATYQLRLPNGSLTTLPQTFTETNGA